jgi:hypothetical protein
MGDGISDAENWSERAINEYNQVLISRKELERLYYHALWIRTWKCKDHAGELVHALEKYVDSSTRERLHAKILDLDWANDYADNGEYD